MEHGNGPVDSESDISSALGGRAVKLPFTRRSSEHQVPPRFSAGMGRWGCWLLYRTFLHQNSTAFNPRRGSVHPLTKHFLGFQNFPRRVAGEREREGGRKKRRREEEEEKEIKREGWM